MGLMIDIHGSNGKDSRSTIIGMQKLCKNSNQDHSHDLKKFCHRNIGEFFFDGFKQYQKEYIKEALGRLKKSDVDILILKYYDELSYADIAKSLSTTEKNVEVKLRRARHRLKEVLEDEY